MAITAFALFLVVPVWAQHGAGGHGGGGGHAGGFSGGGHAGFSGGHSGGFSGHAGASSGFGAHAFSGARPGSAYRGSSRAFTRPGSDPYLHNGTGLNNEMRANGLRANNRLGLRNNGVGVQIRTFGFNNFGFGNRWFHNNCLWWSCGGWGYPWWGWGYYDPWFWDWDDSSYNNDDYYQNLSAAQQMNEQSLYEQQMRQQQAYDNDGPSDQPEGYNGPYARPNYRPRASAPATEEAENVPATVLVFRDQHRQEVHNYAIVGQTLWNFSPQRTEKIPLSDLDLTATTKANQDRGVIFNVPATNRTPSAPPASLQGPSPADAGHPSSSV